MTALLLAMLSAVLYGAGAAVEHRQAACTPAGTAAGGRLLAVLVRRPLWLAGAALEVGGFAAHAAALRTGSLVAVQLILGCSLLVSVGVSARLARRVVSYRCWLAIFTVVTAIGVSVALLGPDEHSASHASGRAALAALVTGLMTVPIVAAGLLSSGRRARPLLLAAAAGMADTCVAVLTMAFAHSFAHGLSAVVTSWPLYALVAAGLASLTLTQTAYQTDAPLITLPVITSVTPVASLAVGVFALHETANLSVARGVTVTACLACGLAALIVLARAAIVSRLAAEPLREIQEEHIRGGEDVGNLGAGGVVGVNVDPADAVLGIDEDDGGHGEVLGAVGVDSVQVGPELFLRGAQLLGPGRQHDAELAGQSVAHVAEDRELEVVRFLRGQRAIGSLRTDSDQRYVPLDESWQQLLLTGP
jgi:hypothetical protein